MLRPNFLARAGSRIADICERWFPDAFVFALAAIVIVFIAGIGWRVKPVTRATEFGSAELSGDGAGPWESSLRIVFVRRTAK